MKLSYRGSTYEVTPMMLEAPHTEITGKYRGLPVCFKAPLGVSEPQIAARLSYRGVEYVRIR